MDSFLKKNKNQTMTPFFLDYFLKNFQIGFGLSCHIKVAAHVPL
jgi:hypothetical protein